jgi:hypothetical protein
VASSDDSAAGTQLRTSLQHCVGRSPLNGLVQKLTEVVLNANDRLGNSQRDVLVMSLQRVIKAATFPHR